MTLSCKFTQKILAFSLIPILGGCASLNQQVQQRSMAHTETMVKELNEIRGGKVERYREPFMQANTIPYRRKGELVTLNVNGAPFVEVTKQLALKYGFSIAYAANLQFSPISIDLKEVDPEEAIRELALSAGLIAIRTSPKTFYVAEQATVTFEVTAKQLNNLAMQFSVEANPSQSGSSSGGGAASASQQATPTGVKFKVDGKSDLRIDNFQKYLESIAGEKQLSKVTIMPDLGLISVRGGGHAIKRVQHILEHFMMRATSQVEVSMAVVEVGLNRNFQFGIDWERVIPLDRINSGGGSAMLSMNNASGITNPAVSTLITTRNITSVINAVEKFSEVEVISRPQILLTNNVPSVLRDVVQNPFVGNVTTTVSGQSGTSQNSSAVNYAQDGVSLSLKATILDSNRVELTLVPILAQASNLAQFPISKDLTLSAYVQPVKDGLLQVIADSGKTMIIGGTKVSNNNNQLRGVPKTSQIPILNLLMNANNDAQESKNLVILVNAKILPAPKTNIVVSEAI